MGEIRACGICGGTELWPLLDMGMQPLAERMGPDAPRYPLRLLQCQECSLVQLSYIAPQAEVFPVDHPYATGNTKALREHFERLALEVAGPLEDGDLAVDIGANDGTLLKAMKGFRGRLVAVEPTGQAAKCREAGFRTWQAFFTCDVARDIVKVCGKAKAVTATNVLAHVPDPHDFMRGVRHLLADDGVFVTENHDVRMVTEGLQIDTVYHEHLRYYGVESVSRLLGMHGMEAVSCKPVLSHGGSIRTTARLRPSGLEIRAESARARLHELVSVAAARGVIYGIGAATRAAPLIHYAGIAEYLACVCEVTGSEKIGTTMPGTGVPVVDEEKLFADQPAFALLFPWHLSGRMIPRLRADGFRGQFIIPLPEPRIVNA